MTTETTSARPNPGSLEALRQGCTCPVIDNHHGEGRPTIGGRSFLYAGNCPLHTREPQS